MKKPNGSKILRVLIPLAVGAVLAAALVLLFNMLREYRYKDLVARLQSYSPAIILAAIALTVTNYMVLSLYDLLALRYVRQSFAYPKTLFISFLSYVFSYNVGLSVFGSSAIRLRFYSAWGLDGAKIAKIVTFCITTFWVGLAAIGGVTLLFGPEVQTSVAIFNSSTRVIGFILTAIAFLYLGACATGKASVSFRSHTLQLPSLTQALGQFGIAALDWFFSAYTLYVLLPAGRPPFLRFLSIFIIAQLAAFTSHVPGGVGILETVLVYSLSSYMPSGDIFGTLIVYRGVFYLFPLFIAIIAFATRELWSGWKKAAGLAKAASPLMPTFLASAVLAAGAVLLFSAATPSTNHRLMLFGSIFPLALLETSHFTASLIGLCLLLLADGLHRRVDAAYYLSIAMLVAGAAVSVMKAFEWEQALILLGIMLLLIPSRPLFYRRAALFTKPTLGWGIAVAMILIASVWIGLFTFKHIQYSHDLWWKFELSRNSPRVLRAGLGVAVCALIFSIRLLLASRPQLPRETLGACRADVERILTRSTSSRASLALLGDKLFHFSPQRNAFLMYAVSGSTCVVLGDPIGDEKEFPDLMWDYYETVRKQGGRVVWYEITPRNLPVFVELGLKMMKIGDEAMVDLAGFSLEEGPGRRLGSTCRKFEADSYSFDVLPPERTRERMTELRAVSDQWLSERKAKEKGFSISFFDPGYLSTFHCAVVMKGTRIVAFANIRTSGDGSEASLDLVRCAKGVPNGTMAYLFARSMEWAKSQSFSRFSLGISTVPAAGRHKAATLWNKAISLLFLGGDGGRGSAGVYNSPNRRAFKNKFRPIWQPRYVVSGGGASLAIAVADIAQLVSKGNRIAEREKIE